MGFFAQLIVVATAAITGTLAQQYSDGYENVNNPTDPVQIRLAYQGPAAMMVSWNTFSQLPNPAVSYGINPNALIQTASSSVSVTYATSLTYNNHVNITGLLPYTTYYYLPQYSNATTPYSFTTARVAGDLSPFTMGVVVDMGTFGALGLSTVVGTGAANPLQMNEQTTIAALTQMKDSYEFMVHAGDIAYADYWLKEQIQGYLPTTTSAQGAQVYEAILNAFYDEMNDITSAKAYMVTPGNHEANCDNGGTTNKTSGQKYTDSICLAGQTNFTGYINHWRMPSGPSGGLGNFWYSYDYGMAHFIMLDTETDLGNGLVGPDEGSPEHGGPFGASNQQINWLANDLASVNRTLTPWVVVFGHRGWYLSVSGSVCVPCQTAFESLLNQYGVDVYINGHAHVYERTAPIYNNVIDPNGLNNPSSIMYVTNGAAGHYDGLDTFTAIQSYSVYHTAADYAWSTLSFLNNTHLTLNSLWSANNSVFDSATIYKAHVFPSIISSSIPSSSTSSSVSSSSTPLSVSLTTTTPSGTSAPPVSRTSSSIYPTYTNFNGQGHLMIWTNGTLQGDIGSAGTWYNTPGQNTATYTAVPLYANGTAFTLQHSTTYCAIAASDFSFGCSASQSGATVFGQTPDGNLTYKGSPALYAPSAASSGAKPTVYATPLPVSLNIVWAGTAADNTSPTSISTTSPSSSKPTTITTSTANSKSSTSSGSTATTTSSSSLSSLTSSTTLTSISSTETSTFSQSSSSSQGTSSPPSTSSFSPTVSSTSSSVSTMGPSVCSSGFNSIATVTVTQSSVVNLPQATVTSVSAVTVSQTTTMIQFSTGTSYITVTQTTASESDFTTTAISTTYVTVTQISASEFDVTSTATQLITLPPLTIISSSTEVDLSYITVTQTTTAQASTVTITQTVASESDFTSTIFATETDIYYVTSSGTETDTLPAVTSFVTLPPSISVQTSTITFPGSTATQTSTIQLSGITSVQTSILTFPASTSTLYSYITLQPSTGTTTLPASTMTISTCPAALSTKRVTSIITSIALQTLTQTAIMHTTSTVLQTLTKTGLVYTTSYSTITDYGLKHTTSTLVSTVYKTATTTSIFYSTTVLYKTASTSSTSSSTSARAS